MTAAEPTAEPTRAAASPGVLPGTIDLLLRPGTFFAARRPVVRGPAALAVVVALGLEIAINRVGKIDNITTGEGFPKFIALVLASLFLGGPLRWWLGGLWCRARIRWSGAPEVDRDGASAIFSLSEMVRSVPVLVWTAHDLGLSPVRPWLSPTLLLAGAWSQFVSYQAVRATFPVSAWKARVWFLIVPGLHLVWLFWW